MKNILQQINKLERTLISNKNSINKYLKNHKIPFEDRLYFYRKLPVNFKNNLKWIGDLEKDGMTITSSLLDSFGHEFLRIEKDELVDYRKFFNLFENTLEKRIEDSGFDANVTEEEYYSIIDTNIFWELVYSYETYQDFLLAREEWVINNLGYFYNKW